MGLPIENFKAYVEADSTQKAKNIPNDAFFLIHGLADATTPYHHSIQLAKKLTENGILFRYTVSYFYHLFIVYVHEWHGEGESGEAKKLFIFLTRKKCHH
jgi:hypothetical protein